MTQRLHLPEVTLFVTAGPDLQLTFESFKRCLDTVHFGDAIFFSEGTPEQTREWFHANAKVVYIQKTGAANNCGQDYFKALPPLMTTTHMLTCDWDAAITDTSMWTPEFMEYDYIGARWPWMPTGKNIGNGGFAMMSKKLMETVTALPEFAHSKSLDAEIGQEWRAKLEMKGIKFPSEELADRFAYERAVPNAPSFGYHGFFNMHRHMSDADIIKLVGKISPGTVKGQHFLELMLTYIGLRKFPVLFTFYSRLRMYQMPEEILARMMQIAPANMELKKFLEDMLFVAEERITK
jgi:hypothetical protein